MDRVQLLGLNGPELTDFVVNDLHESRFRAKQMREWLNRGASTTINFRGFIVLGGRSLGQEPEPRTLG